MNSKRKKKERQVQIISPLQHMKKYQQTPLNKKDSIREGEND